MENDELFYVTSPKRGKQRKGRTNSKIRGITKAKIQDSYINNQLASLEILIYSFLTFPFLIFFFLLPFSNISFLFSFKLLLFWVMVIIATYYVHSNVSF